MRRATIEESRICPNCKKQENQIKMGYNRSGTQHCRCRECGTRYTLEPKKHKYPEEIKELARKSRCFAIQIGMLYAVVDVFIDAYNRFELEKYKYRQRKPNGELPFSVIDFF